MLDCDFKKNGTKSNLFISTPNSQGGAASIVTTHQSKAIRTVWKSDKQAGATFNQARSQESHQLIERSPVVFIILMMTSQEDDLNGRQLQWKTTSMTRFQILI